MLVRNDPERQEGAFAYLAIFFTQCANTEPQVDRTFMAGSNANGFKLSVLTNGHPMYSSLKEQFFSKWHKEASNLRVERIFKVEVRIAATRGGSILWWRYPLSSFHSPTKHFDSGHIYISRKIHRPFSSQAAQRNHSAWRCFFPRKHIWQKMRKDPGTTYRSH